MKPSLLFFFVALLAGGCGRYTTTTLDIGSSEFFIFKTVKGSPAFPYVAAEDGEPADAVLHIVATHVPTDRRSDIDVRLKRVPSTGWEKKAELAGIALGRKRFYGDAVGVEASLGYSAETNSVKEYDDRATVLIPFDHDKQGTAGAFTYRATWTVKPRR